MHVINLEQHPAPSKCSINVRHDHYGQMVSRTFKALSLKAWDSVAKGD